MDQIVCAHRFLGGQCHCCSDKGQTGIGKTNKGQGFQAFSHSFLFYFGVCMRYNVCRINGLKSWFPMRREHIFISVKEESSIDF